MSEVMGEGEKDIRVFPQDGFLEVDFLGEFSVARFRAQLDAAVRACAEHGARRLFIDYSRLAPIPGTLERYEISSYGARVACLATPEQIGDKFGALVARNRGLNVDVFTDRPEAIRWLLGPD